MPGAQALLLRHPPVARAWAGRCYGQSDMGWSREGRAMARTLVTALAGEPITAIVHSGLLRASRLAAMLGDRLGIAPIVDIRWRERDFGAWEGRRWTAIWRETGSEMDGMITDFDRYRPGGGETGRELLARCLAARSALPRAGLPLVITHGGPIALLVAAGAGLPGCEAYRHIPPCGAITRIGLAP